MHTQTRTNARAAHVLLVPTTRPSAARHARKSQHWRRLPNQKKTRRNQCRFRAPPCVGQVGGSGRRQRRPLLSQRPKASGNTPPRLDALNLYTFIIIIIIFRLQRCHDEPGYETTGGGLVRVGLFSFLIGAISFSKKGQRTESLGRFDALQ